jgi:hypothetical protein
MSKMIHGYDPRSEPRGPRRRFLRVPALTLVAVVTFAWLPCFACEGRDHGVAWPELASPASCHGAGEATASFCVPTIRAAGLELGTRALPPALLVALPAGPSLILPVPAASGSRQLPRSAPIHARALYLLHESLLV